MFVFNNLKNSKNNTLINKLYHNINTCAYMFIQTHDNKSYYDDDNMPYHKELLLIFKNAYQLI